MSGIHPWEGFFQHLPAAGTFSKDPRAFGIWPGGPAPVQPLVGGYRCWVWDRGGRVYIDWVSGLGANILGHGHEAWQRRWLSQLHGLYAPSLVSELEIRAAEALAALCSPYIPEPQVRFFKTGSDALAAAVRLCRALTGRELVVKNGYHGWHDWTIASEEPGLGVPASLRGSVVRLEEWDGTEPACVVTEAFPGELPQRPARGLWVLDEVVTGFRYGLPGIVTRIRERPDLICFGKAMANGLPLAAVVGSREVMRGFEPPNPVFASSTSSGEPTSLAAFLATLEFLTPEVLRHIRQSGEALLQQEQLLAQRYPWYRVMGDPERSVSDAGEWHGTLVFELAARGILKNRPNFPNAGHHPEAIQRTVEVLEEVLSWIQAGRCERREVFRLFLSPQGPGGARLR